MLYYLQPPMSSEFSSLLDLAVSRGFTGSQVVSDIKTEILALLRDRYPKTPLNCDIILDISSGKVRVYSDNKDITPRDFDTKAESLARQHLLRLIAAQPSANPDSGFVTKKNFTLPLSNFFRLLTNLLFYGYNSVLALGSSAWFLSQIFSPDPIFSRLIASFVMFFIPISCLVLSVSRQWYRSAGDILQIFFLIEVPLYLVAFFTASISPGSNGFYWFTLLSLFLAPLVLAANSFKNLSPKIQLVLAFFHTQVTLVWGYLLLLFSFFLPGLIFELAKNFQRNFKYLSRYSDFSDPYFILSPLTFIARIGWDIAVFCLLASLILLPFLIFVLLLRNYRREFSRHYAIFTLIIITLSVALSFRPSPPAFIQDLYTLVSASASFSVKDAIAQKLNPQQTQIKSYLQQVSPTVNYLFNYDGKYFDSPAINTIFLKLAYPFVDYGRHDYHQLQSAYNLLFSVYTPTSRSSAKNVLLSSRKISYTPSASGAWAEITLQEEYENQTNTNQEVIYEFSLYPGSVITGLKLGPDLEFTGQIAPKGAAQRTYESQLAVRRDPALLEQIGSNTYRLRVYPIPGNRDFTTLKGKSQKVQFSYLTTVGPDGFLLPDYHLQSNLKFSNATTYLLEQSGQLTRLDQPIKSLPSSFVLCQDSVSDPVNSLRCDETGIDSDRPIAVLLDISLRNKNSKNFKQLVEFASKNPFDFYKYNSEISGILSSSVVSETVFWGQADLPKILGKFNRSYDAIFIVSGSVFPMTNFSNYPFSLNTPVYFIHPEIPAYEIEFVSRIFQSRGLITDSFETAISHYLKNSTVSQNQYLLNKYFSLDLTADVSGPLAKLYQYAKLAKTVESYPTNILNNITKLDELNSLAKSAGIVTPYSSLIALVDDRQQAILNNQSNQYNRYNDQPIRENSISVRPITPLTPLLFSSKSGGSLSVGQTLFAPSFADGPSNAIGMNGHILSGFGNLIILLLPLLFAFPITAVYFISKLLRGKFGRHSS